MEPIILFKIGGQIAEEPHTVTKLAEAIVELSLRYSIIFVHGGGKAINRNLEKIHETPKFKNGLRVTTKEGMKVVEMTLTGFVNKLWVSAIHKANVNFDTRSVGLSGVDAKTLICKPKEDLGFVGEITEVRSEYIEFLLRKKIIPVISPISIDKNYNHYNVNADEVAGAIAEKLKVEHLIFISDVVGVLDEDKKVCLTLNITKKEFLLQSDVIQGGMIPKINSVFKALRSGVKAVHICTFNNKEELYSQIEGNGKGTRCILN